MAAHLDVKVPDEGGLGPAGPEVAEEVVRRVPFGLGEAFEASVRPLVAAGGSKRAPVGPVERVRRAGLAEVVGCVVTAS